MARPTSISGGVSDSAGRVLATRQEPATGLFGEELRRLPRDGTQAMMTHGVEARHEAEETACVRMLRFFEDPAHGPALDDDTGVHDLHVVADRGDHSEIVTDHHQGHAEITAQLIEQREDLRLDRDVESGRRFVGDQQLGSQAMEWRSSRVGHAAAEAHRRSSTRRCGSECHTAQQVDRSPRAALRENPRCSRTDSAICSPTAAPIQRSQRILKTIEICRPRTLRIRLRWRASTRPRTRYCPKVNVGGGRKQANEAERGHTLPQPDSPTTPAPALCDRKLTPSTARTSHARGTKEQ